jgi:hypothetical protein
MEQNQVSFFDYFTNRNKLSLQNLHKLIYQSYSSLQIIHDSGYYHGELGDCDSIILNGDLNNWHTVNIVGYDNNLIHDDKNFVNDDIQTLAYMIWQIIVGDMCYTKDKKGKIIHMEHTKFLYLVKKSSKQFNDYNTYLKLLLWIFETKPTISNILEKISKI